MATLKEARKALDIVHDTVYGLDDADAALDIVDAYLSDPYLELRENLEGIIDCLNVLATSHKLAYKETADKFDEGAYLAYEHCRDILEHDLQALINAPDEPEDDMTEKGKEYDPVGDVIDTAQWVLKGLKDAEMQEDYEEQRKVLYFLQNDSRLKANPLRPGLERAVEIGNELLSEDADLYLITKMILRLRSELEPKREIGWEDVQIWDTFYVDEDDLPRIKLTHTTYARKGTGMVYNYAENTDMVISSSDNQTEDETQ